MPAIPTSTMMIDLTVPPPFQKSRSAPELCHGTAKYHYNEITEKEKCMYYL